MFPEWSKITHPISLLFSVSRLSSAPSLHKLNNVLRLPPANGEIYALLINNLSILHGTQERQTDPDVPMIQLETTNRIAIITAPLQSFGILNGLHPPGAARKQIHQ